MKRDDPARYERQRRLDLLNGRPRMTHPTAVARMLQALARQQWPHSILGRRLGVAAPQVAKWQHGFHPRVHVTTEARVAAVYAELKDRLGPSPRSRRMAERRGWAPPGVWDEETIRNPFVEWPPPAARTLG